MERLRLADPNNYLPAGENALMQIPRRLHNRVREGLHLCERLPKRKSPPTHPLFLSPVCGKKDQAHPHRRGIPTPNCAPSDTFSGTPGAGERLYRFRWFLGFLGGGRVGHAQRAPKPGVAQAKRGFHHPLHLHEPELFRPHRVAGPISHTPFKNQVGRTPWSAADALVGLLIKIRGPEERVQGGPRRTGVRPLSLHLPLVGQRGTMVTR